MQLIHFLHPSGLSLALLPAGFGLLGCSALWVPILSFPELVLLVPFCINVKVCIDCESQVNSKHFVYEKINLQFCTISVRPRFIWLQCEGKKVEGLIPAAMVYEATDPKMPAFPMPMGLLKAEQQQESIEAIADYFKQNSGVFGYKVFRKYFITFVGCELLNMFNVIWQIFIVDYFLGGRRRRSKYVLN